jgi:PrtD family type I secretion system ABC transporter
MAQALGTRQQQAEASSAREAVTVAANPYRAALRRLLPAFVAVLGFSAVLNVLMLTGSVYMLQVYDRVLSSGSVPTLIGLYAIVVLLYGFLGFYDFLRARMMSRAALRLDRDCGAGAARLGLLPAAQKSGTGGEVLRDLDAVRLYLSSPAVNTLFDLLFVPLFLGVLFLVHPLFGWITVGGAMVTAVLAFLNRLLTGPAQLRAATLDSAERDFADRCRGVAETVLAMRMQDAVIARWLRMREAALAQGQSGGDPAQGLAAISRAFRMLLQSSILTLGAWLVIEGRISGGMIIASSILSGRALAPIDQLIGQSRSLGRALLAHRRLSTAFAGLAAPSAALQLPDPKGEITVRQLTVLAPARGDAGPGAEPEAILSGLEFRLSPGDGLGVIGRSASGKSTLARLLVGAQSPDSGEVRYDGATPGQWDPARLGRSIGYLPQHVEMLPGTIRDNIARFDPQIDDDAVIEAARMTGIHEMILNLPEGYATRLGNSSSPRLSGGQVQRLGLARAVCGQPAIVVLDEPNSNLDVEGDNALIGAVSTLRRNGSTVIVMAHRPSAIAAVDKLMILEGGRIRAFGDKAKVLAEASGLTAPGMGPGMGPAPVRPPASASPEAAAEASATDAPSGTSIARKAGPAQRRRLA